MVNLTEPFIAAFGWAERGSFRLWMYHMFTPKLASSLQHEHWHFRFLKELASLPLQIWRENLPSLENCVILSAKPQKSVTTSLSLNSSSQCKSEWQMLTTTIQWKKVPNVTCLHGSWLLGQINCTCLLPSKILWQSLGR